MKIFPKLVLGFLIAVFIAFLVYILKMYFFVIGFSPGNIGTITHAESKNIYGNYFGKYIDSFYVYHPEHKTPKQFEQNIPHYDHLKTLDFYFSKEPKEIYSVGFRGFVSIRFVSSTIYGEFNGKIYNEMEIERIKTRFETEIIPKFEKIILKYESKDSIYY